MVAFESSIEAVYAAYSIYTDLLGPLLYSLVDWFIFSISIACVVAFFGATLLMTLTLAALAFDGVFYVFLRLVRPLVN